MSSTKRLISRFRLQFLSQIISAASGALLVVILARLLDPNGYGLLFLATSVFGMFKIFSRLGVAKSTARYIAEYKDKKPNQIPHILITSIGFIFITTLCAVIALVVSHQHIAGLISEPELVPLLLLGSLYLAFGTLTEFIKKVLQGFEAMKFEAILKAATRLSELLLVVGFVILGFGVVGALIGYTLSFLLASIVGFTGVYYLFYRKIERASEMEPGLRRRMAEYTVPLTATSGANAVDKKLDTILVGVFVNPVAVSFYVVSKQVVQFLEVPISALGFTLSPMFGAQKSEGNIEQASRIYETALTHSLLIYIPAAAGIIILAEPLVTLVFGNDYLGAIPVLQVLGLYVILRAITRITSNALDFLGRAKSRAVIKGITSTLNVILNIILIPLIGVVGAAIATVITYSVYTIANVYIIGQEFELRFKPIVRDVLLITMVTVVMSAVVFGFADYIHGWITFLFVVGTGVFIWALLSLFIGLLDVRKIRSVLT